MARGVVSEQQICCAGVLVILLVTGCALPEPQPMAPQILHIYPDGRMQINDRRVDPADVVIYPDGYGGEKAALKMRVPLHPDYYRDTIIVERQPASGE